MEANDYIADPCTRGRATRRIGRAVTQHPIPSATVVVVRDADHGLEVLLLQRNTGENVWVFPGGKVDGADGSTFWAEGWEPTGRNAAVREAHEEAGIRLQADSLTTFARWVTPDVSPKRFDTLFFLASVPHDTKVTVDGGEIASSRWFDPQAALAASAEQQIKLAPPTYVTVTWLAAHASFASAQRAFRSEPTLVFRPHICREESGVNMLYPGDAGYEVRDPALPGARHRCVMDGSGLRYERSGRR